VCRRGDVAPHRGQLFPSPAVLTSRGSGNDTGHKMSFARQLLFDRRSRGPLPRSPFVEGGGCEGGHAKPDLVPSSSHPVWCCVRYIAACARESIPRDRWMRQATICRESGAVDHQQVAAGAHVESFSMPYPDSFRTAAKRDKAPMRFDPWAHRCSASRRPWQTSHVSAALAAAGGCQY
jgi:hypothetical protein